MIPESEIEAAAIALCCDRLKRDPRTFKAEWDGALSDMWKDLERRSARLALEAAASSRGELDIEDVIEIVAAWATSEEGPPNDVADPIDGFIQLARKLCARDRAVMQRAA